MRVKNHLTVSVRSCVVSLDVFLSSQLWKSTCWSSFCFPPNFSGILLNHNIGTQSSCHMIGMKKISRKLDEYVCDNATDRKIATNCYLSSIRKNRHRLFNSTQAATKPSEPGRHSGQPPSLLSETLSPHFVIQVRTKIEFTQWYLLCRALWIWQTFFIEFLNLI